MSAIIFDFDGTIADSFDYVYDYLASEAKVETEKESLRGLSMVAMARHMGYSWWHMPRLFLQGRNKMRRSIKSVKPFAGMTELIHKLHAEGHELFIVSSNTVKNIHSFLHHYELHTHFLEVYGGVSIFGKAPALRRLMKEQNLEVKDCVYIGDELRDVEAAQSLKLPVIAVGWGFARHQDLLDAKPFALVDTPNDLLQELQNI